MGVKLSVDNEKETLVVDTDMKLNPGTLRSTQAGSQLMISSKSMILFRREKMIVSRALSFE